MYINTNYFMEKVNGTTTNIDRAYAEKVISTRKTLWQAYKNPSQKKYEIYDSWGYALSNMYNEFGFNNLKWGISESNGYVFTLVAMFDFKDTTYFVKITKDNWRFYKVA